VARRVHYYRAVLVREAGMQRLSSRSTLFFEREFPAFGFGLPAFKPGVPSVDRRRPA